MSDSLRRFARFPGAQGTQGIVRIISPEPLTSGIKNKSGANPRLYLNFFYLMVMH